MILSISRIEILLLKLYEAFPCNHAVLNLLNICLRHSQQGLCPAAKAVASSRKNSSVYSPGDIIFLFRPLNSSLQVIHAFNLNGRMISCLSLWISPRVPVQEPLAAVLIKRPNGS